MTKSETTEKPTYPKVSFEFFPPKNEAQTAMLDEAATRLARFKPHYVSVTYGAGGSSQERSRGAVLQMIDMGLTTAAHVTCAGASRESLADTIDWFKGIGIDRFVALRGDPPGGMSEAYRPHPSGFADTADLVRALKQRGAAEVSVSAYPERHPQSRDWEADIDTLKRKVDAGADRAITQFFYDNDLYEAYVERVRAAGIEVPIVPGIMPIHRFSAVKHFAASCGATIPEVLARRFEGLDPDSDAHREAGSAVAAEQIADLIRRGVQVFHLYTLNRSEPTKSVCQSLGLGDADDDEAAHAA